MMGGFGIIGGVLFVIPLTPLPVVQALWLIFFAAMLLELGQPAVAGGMVGQRGPAVAEPAAARAAPAHAARCAGARCAASRLRVAAARARAGRAARTVAVRVQEAQAPPLDV